MKSSVLLNIFFYVGSQAAHPSKRTEVTFLFIININHFLHNSTIKTGVVVEVTWPFWGTNFQQISGR